MQLVCDPADNKKAYDLANTIRNEFVIKASGKVRLRGEGLTNEKLKTGEIEVVVNELVIENPSAPLPFVIGDKNVGEETRLKYRFLDLRTPENFAKFQTRSKAAIATRNTLNSPWIC